MIPNSSNNIDKGSVIPLLKRISAKDTEALSELYDKHSKYLYTIIYYILCDDTDAEVTLKEVFIQIWEKSNSYNEELGNELGWLTRIARNKAIEHLKTRNNNNGKSKINSALQFEKVFDLANNTLSINGSDNPCLDQEQNEVIRALQSLNQNQRDLIEYAYYRGYTQHQLAGHFNIPLETVKFRIRAAMLKLREMLDVKFHLTGKNALEVIE
ncbi:MAG: sigma-70 family RNA polymerase sigma factor [Ignavibacteria bacterium]